MIKSRIIPFVILSICPWNSFAQGLHDLSLEELMEVKVKVATESEKSLREAPGIITVIDDKQIKAMGARNLFEILSTVPGITFGHDVLGNLSIIMRGIWAQEGRILLLIDGMEMNDRSYGTLQLGNHFPADHIKRIEIVRGPGSAIYGGIAELGVINVITKDAEDLKGMEVSTTYSRTSKDVANSMSSFMIGQSADKLKFSLKGMFTDSNFSDRNYTDENGTTANLGDNNSKITNEHLNLKVNYGNFYFRYLRDNYKTKNIILWGDLENNPGSGIIRKPVPKDYLTDARQFGYQADVSDEINVHAYFHDKVQSPYFQPDATNEVDYGNSWRREVQRRVLGAKLQYHPNSKNNFHVGTEQSEDESIVLNRLTHSGLPDTFGNGSRQYKITNTALFGQYDLSTSFVNLTAGLRYDKPSVSKDTLVPRLGMTKVFGKSHVKALFAQAFRAPLIENISLNKDIDPEITTTGELEYGYQFNSNFNWTVNLFSTEVRDIIVYSYDSGTLTEHYNNYKSVKTIGLETEVRYVAGMHNVKFNFSGYKVDQLRADPFKTTQDRDALLGAPTQKFFLSDTLSLTENFALTPSLQYLVNTNSYEWNGATFAEKRLEDQLIGNLFMQYSNFLTKGLGAGLGVNNILNSNIYYAQPYVKEGDYRSGPYPGRSREYIVRFDYKKEF